MQVTVVRCVRQFLHYYKEIPEQAHWVMPDIPHFGRLRRPDHFQPRSLRPTWAMWQNPISTKNTKISQVWWHTPVVSATWETEAEGSLEPGRSRLQRAMITPLHPSLSDRMRPYLKKDMQGKAVKDLFDSYFMILLLSKM